MKYTALLLLIVPFLWVDTEVPPTSDSATITEWEVPWEDTRPRDPYVDGQDRVWFVGQRGNYAAYLMPSDGTFERFDLPEGTGPHNLIVDDDGTVWIAGNRDAYIGAMDPESGEVELIEVPTPRARPYGIVTTDDGRPWFTEFGTNKLATVDPETMELEEISLPREDARPRRLDITSDGMIWYIDYAEGYLGRYNPESDDIEEWRTPGEAESHPYGMIADNQDRLWFVETGPSPNRFVGFAPSTEAFFSTTDIESGGGTVRHMYYDADDNAVWFGTDTNTIGRADLP